MRKNISRNIENDFVFDVTYPWKNKKNKEKIIKKLNVTSKQKAFLLNGKNNRYLGEHFLGIKEKEIYLFNKKDKRYLKEYMGEYLYLETNIYQYNRLKEAKKFGIRSGILLHGRKFYPIESIEVTKSGNMKIPVDDFILKFEEDFKSALEEPQEKFIVERVEDKKLLEKKKQLFEKGKIINFLGWYFDEWERCPYRLIRAIKEGANPYDEYMNSVFIKEVIVKRGVDFEKEKLSEIKWEMTTESLESLVEKRHSVKKPYLEVDGSKIKFDVPLFFKKIMFKGTPEMICEYKGNMVPLDVKSHKELTLLDEERICYYAFLMKSLFDIEPTHGLIWSKNGVLEVKINEFRLQQMFEKIEQIWHYANSDQMPLQQRTGQCSICTLDKSCVKDLRERGDLTLIYGVGLATAEKMRKENINNINDLLSQNKFLNFKLQAEAMVKEKIIKIDEMKEISDNVVYVDIETTLGGSFVWLIGYLYKGEFHQLYADKEIEEKSIIKKFLVFLKSLDNPIFVEYSETYFDYRNILEAVNRHELDVRYFSNLKNIDLYWTLRKAYLFPTLTRKLKDIAHYLGYPSKTELDGPTVALGYQKHLDTGEPIPKEYFVYNEDDVRMLPFILKEATKQCI